MNHTICNPILPPTTYIPDGEPHVFGDRVYLYGSHDQAGGTCFCPLDYECWSAPVDDLTDWRCEGTYPAAVCCNLTNGRMPHLSNVKKNPPSPNVHQEGDVV